MKFFLFLLVLSQTALAQVPVAKTSLYDEFINTERILLSRSDLIIGEHLVNILKLTDKGYLNQELVGKVLTQAESSKHFNVFIPFLKSIKEINKLTKVSDLTVFCRAFIEKKEVLPLERSLERRAGNYCREKALESIGREIEKTKLLSDEANFFIQEHLKFFLTKKNRKNFAFFLQSQSSRPEILKKLSQEVTVFSVKNEIVPSHDVLKDIVINEQITKLIQDKGFNPLQNKNVFYGEFGKLIETGYKVIEQKGSEEKIKEHYVFLKNYLELNQDHLPVGLCLTRLNDYSKAVFRLGHKDLSRDIFKYIVKKNNKEINEDALFFYLWTYISTEDFAGAIKVAESYQLFKNYNNISDPRLKFWLAQAQESKNKTSEAIKYYENIIETSPLSFYAIMSTKKLQVIATESPAITYYKTNVNKNQDKVSIALTDLSEDHISSLVRLKAWSKIDSQKMMDMELKRLNLHSLPDVVSKVSTDKQLTVRSDLHLIYAKLIQESKNYLATFRYLYGVMDRKEVEFNRSLLEILYPRPFYQDLVKALKNDKLDPFIVLALIRQESVFNPIARSPVGARGLMQLMPATAKRFRRSVKDKHLTDPTINIDLGTKYFKGLVKRYDGNLVYVLSAYNAGESRVERWKNLYFQDDVSIVKNIEQIPFLETRNYVKLIFRNIYFYKLLTENNELADSREFNKIFDVSLGFNK
jgi:soluble lytic murein transglycosylase